MIAVVPVVMKPLRTAVGVVVLDTEVCRNRGYGCANGNEIYLNDGCGYSSTNGSLL